jgi:rod shape-determining protein MreD
VVFLALVIQVSILDRLPLPGSTAPDVVLLAVAALALVNGPLIGLVTGFCAGLAVDVVPPADHAIGLYALVYCVVGYAVGLLAEDVEGSAVVPLAVVAGGAAVGTLLYGGLGLLLADPRAHWPLLAHRVPVTILYDLIVSPFVAWAVLKVSRRGEGERARISAVPGSAYRTKERI